MMRSVVLAVAYGAFLTWSAVGAEPAKTPRRGLFKSLSNAVSEAVDPLEGLERSLLFHPAKHPQGNWRPQGLVFEDATFQAADGTRLHGWYCPAVQPRAIVLFCHGNGGNVSYWAWMLRELQDSVGVSVLAFDYRGYGRSDGKPTEAGLSSDARAARAWLAGRGNIAEKDIVLMGQSLGGAVAVDLAAADGARALVLESTFNSASAAAEQHFPSASPQRWMRYRFDSASKIGKYRGPLLQSHGDRDGVIAPALGKKLFDAANEPKQFLTLRGHDHNDPLPPNYYRALAAFLDRLPPSTPPEVAPAR